MIFQKLAGKSESLLKYKYLCVIFLLLLESIAVLLLTLGLLLFLLLILFCYNQKIILHKQELQTTCFITLISSSHHAVPLLYTCVRMSTVQIILCRGL